MAAYLTALAIVAALAVVAQDRRVRRERRRQLMICVLAEEAVTGYRASCQTLANVLRAANDPPETFYRVVGGQQQPAVLDIDAAAPVPEPQHTPGSPLVILSGGTRAA